MNMDTRKELTALAFLSRLTRKEVMVALRSLEQQPVHAKERTRAEVFNFIAHHLTPTEVAAEVGRHQRATSEATTANTEDTDGNT